jgi:tRNA modification GTPase
MDTIFALSSGAGRAGVAVIRISGPEARAVLTKMAPPLPVERRASVRRIVGPDDGALLDQGLVLWFSGPRSVTGEDVAELHVHGGRAVVSAVLAALATLPRLRPAEPGEFTRRAFFHNCLDLAQVEGLADLIAAETEAQRRAALRHTDGSLSKLYESWRSTLLKGLAYVEATIDFSDEELPTNLVAKVAVESGQLAGEIDRFLERGRHSQAIREGLSIAIIGAPNVGKSSLMNALAGRDVAIVSERAGTTRDVISLRLDLGGHLVVLSDTAGIREALDEIEVEGVIRARREAEAADIRLAVADAASGSLPQDIGALIREGDLVAFNKVDLAGGKTFHAPAALKVSAKTGAGLDDLVTRLTELVRERVGDTGSLTFTHIRHRTALEGVVRSLRAAARTPPGQLELMAEELRVATRELGRITGRVDVEDLLDLVFRDFCIGK